MEFDISTALSASAADVWARVSTMPGVNDELKPWFRMTWPMEFSSFAGADVHASGPGEVAFHSWLLAGGVVPFDRHALSLVSLDDSGRDGGSFVEESTSWLQRRWHHEREVVPLDTGGCRVTDRLIVQPRLRLAAPLVARVVPWIFAKRHERLAERFGLQCVGF